MNDPDFWLIDGGKFWTDVGSEAIACRVLRGPGPMVDKCSDSFFLVRVEPTVSDFGVESDRVIVQYHEPDWREGDDWAIWSTPASLVHPATPSDAEWLMGAQTVGGHRVHAVTRVGVPVRSSG